ncbi:MAG: DNA polymerase III subunit alpha, partial [Planctomycetota bacterium]
ILGFEAYVAPKGRHDRERDPVAGWHLTLLARNLEGWQNLIKLSSAGYMEGFYYVPRIDRELIERHSGGLVALSGCLSSELSYYTRRGDMEKAKEVAGWYHDVFGENYFLEIQRHGIEEQERCLEACVELSSYLGRDLVATNDFHYEEKADADAQDVLVCINTGKTVQDQNRMKMSTEEFYFKSDDEMRHLFRDLPQAADTTLAIAERCNVEIEFGNHHVPAFDVPDGQTQDAYFKNVSLQGLTERYGENPAAAVSERFDLEFDVIQRMGFASYFLIVWDFIRYARQQGIPVGPGRGSAAGSIVAYCLGITDVDPLKYDLLFERFLNEERISMPDIDIDFCRDRREEVISYVQEKFGGKERVAQIITFGRMAAKAVIRDVGRALDLPLRDVDRIAKKIPGGPGVTLTSAMDQDPELKAMATDGDEVTRKLFDYALRLEGCHRNAGTHAAGIVIADAPLTEYVPLYKSGDDVSTQFSMDIVEQLGLLKMDFLGLKTLTLIETAIKLIRAEGGEVPDFRSEEFKLYDDEKTYDLMCRGESFGVFQLESSGMRDLLKRLKPRTFEESLALIALFRPGPLDSGMTDVYCDRKNELEPVAYDHALLEPILEGTYGVIVYQEQVMLIAHKVAGLTLNQADSLRKAMGKKKPEVMEPFREPFLIGCEEHGMPRDVAQSVWDKMATFARYGFNKSHSAAYSVVTYQTAWLKANHPRQFMAALLTVDSGNMDKVSEALEECRRMGIPVLKPDVNASLAEYSVEGEAIRFGLTSVRGVGRQAADCIVAGRADAKRYESVFDVAAHADTRHVNRSALEALVKAGACDDLGGHRAQLAAALDSALRAASTEQADRRAGQMNLLGGAGAASVPPPPLPNVAPWPESETLQAERETTGRYWSSHPLAEHEETVRVFRTHSTNELAECMDGTPVVLGGIIGSLQERVIRSGRNEGKRMARFRIEDFDGSIDAVVFSEAFLRYRDKLQENQVLFFSGDVDASRDEVCVRVSRIHTPEDAPQELAGSVQVQLVAALVQLDPSRTPALDSLHEVLARYSGDRPLLLGVEPEPGLRVVIRAATSFCVTPTPALLRELEALETVEGVRLHPARPKRKERRSWKKRGN